MQQELALRNCRWRLRGEWCRLDEIMDWKLKLLLEKYGMVFLDDKWYFLVKKSKWQSVYCIPIWSTREGERMEKYKPKDTAQRRLF